MQGLTKDYIPQVIYFSIDGINGYIGTDGLVTNKVCALHLSTVNSSTDDIGMLTFCVTYKQNQSTAW